MTEGRKITNNLEENTIYPLKHVKHQWICDWVESTNINYSSRKEMNEDNNKEILNFLEKHIPSSVSIQKSRFSICETRESG